ncbi:cytochrome C oxidase subunit IV family protein [Roseovarius sp. S4756]|uniref:cytochrome C oxidase subunit IV family protein n=1 Tax=Roseovarius maritimus TaxID=3342637 RepID=UPI00372CD278
MKRPDILTRAWLTLLILSGVSTVAAAAITAGYDARIAGGIVLFLALMKARVILSRYLGLSEAPSWRRGFNLSLTLFMLGALGLYLIPSL